MATWAEFEAAAPDLASTGRRVLLRDGISQGLLATVGGDGLPRIHPVYVSIVGPRLATFILPSAKGRDLELDGRYALHGHQDPEAPDEFEVRGTARLISDKAEWDEVAAAWYFSVDDRHRLFELSIESALVGFRENADAWPPRYASWTPKGGRRE